MDYTNSKYIETGFPRVDSESKLQFANPGEMVAAFKVVAHTMGEHNPWTELLQQRCASLEVHEGAVDPRKLCLSGEFANQVNSRIAELAERRETTRHGGFKPVSDEIIAQAETLDASRSPVEPDSVVDEEHTGQTFVEPARSRVYTRLHAGITRGRNRTDWLSTTLAWARSPLRHSR